MGPSVELKTDRKASYDVESNHCYATAKRRIIRSQSKPSNYWQGWTENAGTQVRKASAALWQTARPGRRNRLQTGFSDVAAAACHDSAGTGATTRKEFMPVAPDKLSR